MNMRDVKLTKYEIRTGWMEDNMKCISHAVAHLKDGRSFILSDHGGCPRENGQTILGGEHRLPSVERQHGVLSADYGRFGGHHPHVCVWKVCECMVGVTSPHLDRGDRIGGKWVNDMEVDGVLGGERYRRHG